jgi:GNAT superfamily N-acetyltransferase
MTLQYQAFAEGLYDALRPDPFYRTLEQTYGDPAGAREAMLRYYDLSIREGVRWGRLGLPADGTYGISVWAVPLDAAQAARKSEAKQQALVEAMGDTCARCFAGIEASMKPHEQALGLQDDWYLSILGVSPEVQGQGLGGQLIGDVLAEADQIGASSYLTTFTPRNIGFYKKHGYVEAGRFPEPVTGSDFWILTRPPMRSDGDGDPR